MQRLKIEIKIFKQRDTESLSKAMMKFNKTIFRCHGHMLGWSLFYLRFRIEIRGPFNVATRWGLMNVSMEEVKDIIEGMLETSLCV